MASTNTTFVNNPILIEKLHGKNYKIWKTKCQMILLRNDLFGFIDGTDVNPRSNDATVQSAWTLRNGRAMFDILLSCNDNQIAMVQTLTIAKEIWDYLKAIYEQNDRTTKLMINKKFTTLKMIFSVVNTNYEP